MALIPKGTLSSKRTATFAVIVSFIGLLVVPILAVPAMLVAGFSWRSAPRWARVTLVVGAVVFAAFLVAGHHASPGGQHS